MSELRQVYTPFPAYSPSPSQGGGGVGGTPAGPHPKMAGLRVVVTAKRKAKKEREESKQQQPPLTPSTQHHHPRAPSSSTSTILRLPPPSTSTDEEEKEGGGGGGGGEGEEEDDDLQQLVLSEEQQRRDVEAEIALSWVEFVDPKTSTRVWINVRTGEVEWEKPATMEEEEEEEGEDNDEGSAGRGGGGGGGKKEPQAAVDVPEDELADLFTLASIPPSRLLSSLRYMDRAVEQVTTKAVNLPPALLTSLSTIHSHFTSSISVLSSLVSSADTSPVESLIAYDTLPWSFSASQASSHAIDYYRAAAAAGGRERGLGEGGGGGGEVDVHPMYLSASPLPAHVRKYRVQVRMWGDEAETVPRLLQVEITDATSATELLKHALYKDQQRGAAAGALDDFILKAVGSEEYMMGERALFHYDYVRQHVRESEEVHLVVVKRAAAIAAAPQLPSPHPLTTDYLAKVNPEVAPITRTSFLHLSLKAPFASLAAFSAYDVHLPFRYKVVGLDYLSPVTLPLLSPALSAGGASSSSSTLPSSSFTSFTLRSFLFHGSAKLPDSLFATPDFHFASSHRFGSWTGGVGGGGGGGVLMDAMPRGVRVGFVLVGRREEGREVVLAWVVKQVVDEGGEVLAGRRELKMWGVKEVRGKKHGSRGDDEGLTEAALLSASNAENECDRECARLTVLFQPFALPVVYPLYPPPLSRAASKTVTAHPGSVSSAPQLTKQVQKQLDELLKKDALYPFTPADLTLLHTHRAYLARVPHALPTFLLSVNWCSPEQRLDAHRLLKEWAPFFTPISALLLLDVKYADATVREHAVGILRRLADAELAQYLLQLVQCLKYEAYHHSELSSFLVQRGIASPIVVGQPLFWHLKNELHAPYHCERYVLVMEELLSFSPLLCHELVKQVAMVKHFTRLSEMVQRLKAQGLHDAEVEKEYHRELHQLNDDLFAQQAYFLSPLHPKKRATTLVVDKCRYMSSKMRPLWLVFRNADPFTHQHPHHHRPQHARGPSAQPPPSTTTTGASSQSISSPKPAPHPDELLYMIFKSGDDLRQDILTLQLLRYMDSRWLSQQIDLRLKPYAVVATGVNEHGDGVGLIDVVRNSETTSGIQLNPQYGGGTAGAFKLDPIDLFIRHHNRGVVTVADAAGDWVQRPAYDVAVENFVQSCAGYCVATFVLGIGDRHNGNIMVTKRGQMFHIDFGHFLGNFKKKFGVNRERAAFVFTPEMAHVMGGEKGPLFKRFVGLSKRAFQVLRGSVNELETLFLLMCNAGMPELTGEGDIGYMREKLLVDGVDSKAEGKLVKEIGKSLGSNYRRFDNWVHNIRHK